MEQPDKTLSDAIEQMERYLKHDRLCRACDLPMSVMLSLARILRDESDARRAIVRLAEHREQLNQGAAQRLTGEIAERSQRQLEITGRLAEVERGLKALARRVDGLDGGPGIRQADAERLDREQADAVTEAIEYARMHAVACDVRHSYLPSSHKEAEAWLPHSWVVDAIMALQHDLANARADAKVHQSARQTLEAWEAEACAAFNIPQSETGAHNRKWMLAELGRLQQRSASLRAACSERDRLATVIASQDQTIQTIGLERDRNAGKTGDLEAQVAALQKAIDDVWALVEQPDGYGSPFWSEPGLDDTTPAQAVERVLAHLRRAFDQEHAVVVERARDYTDELTEALGCAPRSITWSRGLDLVRETILQRNGARELVAAQAKAITMQAGRIRTLEERNETQAFTIAQYQETPRAEAMAVLNAADRQSDDDQICGC